jgi:hypothetical protein
LNRSPLPILFLLLLALPGLRVGPASAERPPSALPINEGFEAFAGGLPPGWEDATFGEVRASFGEETHDPREGERCWRIQVLGWESGEARVARRGIPLRSGETYTVEVWLKGRGLTAPVEVALRKDGPSAKPYLARQFAVGTEWRRCVLQGRCPSDDPNAVLTLGLAGTGTLYVDALRAVEGDLLPQRPEPPPPPPVKGNLLYNSSFELGTDGWVGPEGVTVARETSPEGEQFVRWKGGPDSVEARPFLAWPRQTYTFSAFLRSPEKGAKVEMAAVELRGGPRAGHVFDLAPEWKRYSFAAILPCERSFRYVLALRLQGGARALDVDAVQAEEGDLTDYRPAAPLEIAVRLPRKRLFPQVNEMVTFPVQAYGWKKIPEHAAVRYRLEGFYGETPVLGSTPVPSGAPRAEVPLRFRIPLAGTLRLVVEGLVGGEPVSRSEAVLTALPASLAGGNGGRSVAPLREAGVPCPSLYSWQGAEEQARAAARSYAKTLAQTRAGGSALVFRMPEEDTRPRSFEALSTDEASLLDYDGSGKPTLAARAASVERLGGAAFAGQVRTDLLTAIVFRKGGDTAVAFWSPGALLEGVDVTLKLNPRNVKAFTLMGNPKGVRAGPGTATVSLRSELAYLQVTDTPAAVVMQALKGAPRTAGAGSTRP